MSEISTKPYLLRAIHEWCVDQGLTPYLAVLVDAHVRVPASVVKDNQVVLNVSSTATDRLQMGNELITFQARFGGQPFPLSIPVDNVLAIYARENGQGMAFEVAVPQRAGEASEEADDDGAETEESTVVENDPLAAEETNENDEDAGSEATSKTDGDVRSPPRGGGRPHLKVIK